MLENLEIDKVENKEFLKALKVTNYFRLGEIISILGVFVASFIITQIQIHSQSTRSDELYNQFIALVKEVKSEKK